MSLIKYCLYGLFMFFALVVLAQEIPPIQLFSPQDYGAEDQNWAITQSTGNFIYVANNKGLLEYNGASWTLYNSPNNAILRTVKSVGDKIYSGGYMGFGYWAKNKKGVLEYASLSENQNFAIKEDEDFWGIIDIEGYVLFQSFERIYVFNIEENSFNIIESDSRINKMFKVDETIFFQKNDIGVFEIVNGNENLIISAADIDNNELINIFKLDTGLLLQTVEHGFYKFENRKLNKWDITSDQLLESLSIYSSARLADGSFVLGTISNGIVQLDKEGNYLLSIDQSDGLSNNTVLSILEDGYGNIWLGLDNGINVLNINSPFQVYTDKQGVLGTVYTAAETEDFRYLGTNQGLFYKLKNSESQFKLIKGTTGQVWFLSFIKGVLFCGHDKGTYIIKELVAEQISSEIGTWVVKELEDYPNLLIQGNYKGLNILEKNDDTWRIRNKIEGFNISSRNIEFLESNELLINHEHKGVFKILIDNDFRNVIDYKKLPKEKGFKSSIAKYNNDIYYSNKQGFFVYDAEREEFTENTLLSDLLGGDEYVSGRLFNDSQNNKLWGFSKSGMVYMEPGKLSNEPTVNTIPISSEVRKTKSGFENILNLGSNIYLIGTTEGYLTIDLNKVNGHSLGVHLTGIEYGGVLNDLKALDLDGSSTLANKANNIKFNYSVTNFSKFLSSKYQYRLTGFYDNWSDWSSNPQAFFKNLPHGDYVFEVRAMVGGIVSNNTVSYEFEINKPWYIKPLAIVVYALLVLLFIYVLYYYNKRHFKKQQQKLIEKKERQLEFEQLENQRQLIQFKNKNLQLDIDNKNRELGMATMNLVKRNELLSNIKDELSNSKSPNEIAKVIKLINRSINNTGDWKLFEEAFNNVDKDFMKKIKSLHPAITASDLRLCAYLRLNLSSKEIAPLLNISHKSVEVKRYRLRKKMDLAHDQSLSNYIIDL